MVAIVTYMFGVCFVQACTTYLLEDHGADAEVQEAIVKYWGSVTTAMVSLYMASTGGDSWTFMAMPLKETGAGFHCLFLVYIAFFMFVLANALTGLCVEATMQHAKQDDQVVIQEEMRKKSEYVSQIAKLFDAVDTDRSGEISWEEFHSQVNSPEMLAFTSSLEIDISDAEEFFRLISCNGRDPVNAETFVIGCMKLKGPAKSLDLLGLVEATMKGNYQTTHFMKYCKEELGAIGHAVSQLQVAIEETKLTNKL